MADPLPSPDPRERRRKQLNEAQHRFQARRAMGLRVGRYDISEGLLNALVITNRLTEREAMDKGFVDAAVARLLDQFIDDVGVR